MKIYTRAEWGARPFRTPRRYVPLSARREITIHYPGAGTPPRDYKGYAKWIERIHMDQNGWSAVGYNYFVDADGRVAEGCGRDIQGAHSPPHNYDGIGINVWTSNGVPTEAGKRAARELYELLCSQAGRRLRIGWHGRDYATECPGPTLRNWAKAGMPVTGSPGTGGAAPTTPPTPKEFLDMNEKEAAALFRKIVREEIDRRLVQQAPARFQNAKGDKKWANASFNTQVEADTARGLSAARSIEKRLTKIKAPARFQNSKGDHTWTLAGFVRQIDADNQRILNQLKESE